MGKSERFGALDGWRGLFAVTIAVTHFESNGWIHNSTLIQNAFGRVDFFFIISGFVLAHVYEQRLEKGGSVDFLIRRIARIWPLHVVMLLAFIGLELTQLLLTGDGFQDDRGLSRIPMNLFLLHGLGFETALTWNFPSWSVSVEAALYVAFVAFILLPRAARAPVAAAIVVLGLATLALINPSYLVTTFEYGPIRGAVGFFTGYLVHRLRQRVRLPVGTLGEVLCLAMILIYMVFLVAPGPRTMLTIPVFAIATYVFTLGQGAISAGLKSPVLAALGRWSYSIYMLHAFFFVSFRALVKEVKTPWFHLEEGMRVVGPPVVIDLITIAYVIVVIAAASVTYRLIEMPGQTLLVNLVQRLRGALAAHRAHGADAHLDGGKPRL